jgi:hypothetical protein
MRNLLGMGIFSMQGFTGKVLQAHDRDFALVLFHRCFNGFLDFLVQVLRGQVVFRDYVQFIAGREIV